MASVAGQNYLLLENGTYFLESYILRREINFLGRVSGNGRVYGSLTITNDYAVAATAITLLPSMQAPDNH
jgi:hypothetical protein